MADVAGDHDERRIQGRDAARASSTAARWIDRPVRLDRTLMPSEAVASRVWEPRSSVRPSDAWYVAVAGSFGLPLATFDARLVSAPGPTRRFITPR